MFKKRELSQTEKSLIVQFYVEDYQVGLFVDDATEEEIELYYKDLVDTAIILNAIDTKFGTVVFLIVIEELIENDFKFIEKTVSQFLIDHDANVESIEDWDFISEPEPINA